MMPPHAIDPEHLRVQYSDNERLRVRLETHQRYSERPDDFVEWVLHHAALLSSQRLLSLGYTPTEPPGAHFTLDHVALVQEVFPGAERHIRRDAFLFPDAAPALRYYVSGRIDGILERPPDGSHRPGLLAAVEARIADIIASEGSFRVLKDSGCFVAEI